MNSFIEWLNKHLVPVAAKIGAVRWLIALRDAFIAIMPAMMAGSIATVLNALVRDIPTKFGWMGIVNSMQWLIGINAMVWTGTLAILGLIFSFTFGYQLAIQYKVELVTGGIVTLGTFIMSLPQNFTGTLTSTLSKGATKILTDSGMAVAGKALPYVWTRNCFDLYAWIGGAGSTLLLLVAILVFSKRDDQRSVAKLAIGPGFFNINEPVMFGMPIVLDPIYFIPFVLAPVVTVSIAYAALSAGWVAPITNNIGWSMPPIMNALVATMDWRSVVLQLFNAAVAFAIYVPFVKAANKIKPAAIGE